MTFGGKQDSILVVCTGNICRSPLAEHLLQHNLNAFGIAITCRSAGTHAVADGAPPIEIKRQAAEWGLSVAAHSPTQVTENHVRDATLVLTAERSHRAQLVALVPSASRKVFTLKQFARIIDAINNSNATDAYFNNSFDDLSSLVDEIADFRALTPPSLEPSDDDVADPYRRTQSDYDLAAEQLRDSASLISTFFSRALT